MVKAKLRGTRCYVAWGANLKGRLFFLGSAKPPDMQEAVAACYGDTLDGRAAARYDTVLRALITGAELPLRPEPAPPFP